MFENIYCIILPKIVVKTQKRFGKGANYIWDPVIISLANLLSINQNGFGRDQMTIYIHYGDVIMGAMTSQITGVSIVSATVYSGADQRNIKAPRHWPLWREFTGGR